MLEMVRFIKCKSIWPDVMHIALRYIVHLVLDMSNDESRLLVFLMHI